MRRLPMTVTLKMHSDDDDDGKTVNLWIPLFLIVPIILAILLVLLLIALPFLVIYVLVTWNVGWWRYVRHGVPAFFETMHAFPGLKVDVENSKQKIYIDVN